MILNVQKTPTVFIYGKDRNAFLTAHNTVNLSISCYFCMCLCVCMFLFVGVFCVYVSVCLCLCRCVSWRVVVLDEELFYSLTETLTITFSDLGSFRFSRGFLNT